MFVEFALYEKILASKGFMRDLGINGSPTVQKCKSTGDRYCIFYLIHHCVLKYEYR